MIEPQGIKIEILIANHKEIIAEHGGMEGVRDFGLLESACVSPKQLFHYSVPKPSICDLAAKYAYSITRNHPFVDGNKRMAAIACELFLELNEHTLNASDEEAYFVFQDLSANEMDEVELAFWLKRHVIYS